MKDFLGFLYMHQKQNMHYVLKNSIGIIDNKMETWKSDQIIEFDMSRTIVWFSSYW